MATTKNKETKTAEEIVSTVLAMTAANESNKKFKDVKVIREGDKIILPTGMSYNEGRKWLTLQEESEEKNVGIHCTLDGFPLDGAVALQKAMEEIYGFTALVDTPGFWGPEPPMLVQIPTRDGKFITATMGRMKPPMYEGGYLETMASGMTLVIKGEIKKKHEPEVQKMLAIARDYLRENSIYKGSSFMLDLSYITEERRFHPLNDAPKFMDVSNVDENGIILNENVENSLKAFIYGRIENSEAYQSSGIPLKHTALFAGKFGTGKTLTSRVIASKGVRNGWTFIYLKTIEQFAECLKLAELYAPAIVFTEDIDLVTAGERDINMNEVLNTLDGVDTKDKPIITILTTNKAEEIEKAMLRAGRVDTLVLFDYPNADSAFRFVELYAKNDDGKSLLSPMDENEKIRVGQSLAGKIPAFIAEAVHKAKCLAVAKHGADVIGKVSGDDVIWAAESQKPQLELLEGKTVKTPAEIIQNAVAVVGAALNYSNKEEILGELEQIKNNL